MLNLCQMSVKIASSEDYNVIHEGNFQPYTSRLPWMLKHTAGSLFHKAKLFGRNCPILTSYKSNRKKDVRRMAFPVTIVMSGPCIKQTNKKSSCDIGSERSFETCA